MLFVGNTMVLTICNDTTFILILIQIFNSVINLDLEIVSIAQIDTLVEKIMSVLGYPLKSTFTKMALDNIIYYSSGKSYQSLYGSILNKMINFMKSLNELVKMSMIISFSVTLIISSNIKIILGVIFSIIFLIFRAILSFNPTVLVILGFVMYKVSPLKFLKLLNKINPIVFYQIYLEKRKRDEEKKIQKEKEEKERIEEIKKLKEVIENRDILIKGMEKIAKKLENSHIKHKKNENGSSFISIDVTKQEENNEKIKKIKKKD